MSALFPSRSRIEGTRRLFSLVRWAEIHRILGCPVCGGGGRRFFCRLIRSGGRQILFRPVRGGEGRRVFFRARASPEGQASARMRCSRQQTHTMRNQIHLDGLDSNLFRPCSHAGWCAKHSTIAKKKSARMGPNTKTPRQRAWRA